MTFILAQGCGTSGPDKEMKPAIGPRVSEGEIKSLNLMAAKGL